MALHPSRLCAGGIARFGVEDGGGETCSLRLGVY